MASNGEELGPCQLLLNTKHDMSLSVKYPELVVDERSGNCLGFSWNSRGIRPRCHEGTTKRGDETGIQWRQEQGTIMETCQDTSAAVACLPSHAPRCVVVAEFDVFQVERLRQELKPRFEFRGFITTRFGGPFRHSLTSQLHPMNMLGYESSFCRFGVASRACLYGSRGSVGSR